MAIISGDSDGLEKPNFYRGSSFSGDVINTSASLIEDRRRPREKAAEQPNGSQIFIAFQE